MKIGPIPKGWNRVEHHDLLVQAYEPLLKTSAEAGFKQVICFSGNREGMSDEQGLENCAKGLQRMLPLCKKLGVTLVMELLNSKVNHPDYMCDKSAWGVSLVKKLGLAALQAALRHLPHADHGGRCHRDDQTRSRGLRALPHWRRARPCRNRRDTGLNYPAIIKAIQETGYRAISARSSSPSAPISSPRSSRA